VAATNTPVGAAVTRRSGQAEVHLADPGFDVTLHEDQLRVLRFKGDTVTSRNRKEVATATRRGAQSTVTVSDFVGYTIPTAVIVGG
jgi:hypothetical protein